MKRLIYICSTLFALCGTANASLILDITDLGAGQTRWQFSGSDTIFSGGPSTRNGFWFDEANTNGFDSINTLNSINPVSGTFSATINGDSFALDDIFIQTFRIGVRISPSNPGFVAGDSVSWAGDLVTNIALTNFSIGMFTGTTLGTSGDFQTLTEGFQINVGQQQHAVPEPGSLPLFAAGVLAFGITRRRMKKNH